MTIRELEVRCGLDRATIRYYEKEGLLAPVRQANGYRDYSEEDAADLEKIALLRRLGLSLEMIRTVRRGELPLGVALEKQSDTLLQQREETDRALQISRILREEGVSYQTLQPMKYRERLLTVGALAAERLPPPPRSTANDHPFLRWLARSLDSVLFLLPVLLVLMYGARVRVDNPAVDFATPFLGWLAGMMLEPLLLSTWGYTPGKWIMGLRLRTLQGGAETKLTFGEAFIRYWKLQVFAFGLNIPPFSYICGWNCWKRCRNGEDQPWDEEFVYIAEERSWSLWGMLTAWALIVALIVFAAVDTQRPIHRTDRLTRTAYLENVNDILEYHLNSDRELSAEGIWFSDSLSLKGDIRDKLEIYEENGIVTGVSMTFTLKLEKHTTTWSRQPERYAAAMGLLSGSRSVKIGRLSDDLNDLFDDWEGTIETNGWVIRQWVENPPESYRDFQMVNSYVYYTGTPQADHPVVHFSIEKAE